MTFKVEVLQEDIDAGGASAFSCPLARAIKRNMPGEVYVAVHQEDVHIGDDTYHHSQATMQWVIDYDYWIAYRASGLSSMPAPQPFTAELEWIDS